MNQVPSSQQLLAELDLGSARGGKAGINREQLEITVIRPLTEADLPAISNPPAVTAPLALVKNLRHSHHRLAQLMAEGKPGTEIGLVTGYSQSYISNIKHDPAFAELVAYYSEQRATVFIDAAERLRVLGIDATEQLHDQLHDQTQNWSRRELMELINMTLVKPGQVAAQRAGQAAGPSANLSLEVKFVGARQGSGPIVETSFTDVTPASEPGYGR